MPQTIYASGAETPVAAGDRNKPSVAVLNDGGWVVTSHGNGQIEFDDDIYQQRYNSDGIEVGPETRVNTAARDQGFCSVTGLKDGGWVVTWQSYGQDGDTSGIYQQRYISSGIAVGPETQVNFTTKGNQYDCNVIGLKDGGWVVTWTNSSTVGDIYQQRFGSNGVAVGLETRVNSTTANYQFESRLAALTDGGWVVTWTSNEQDGDQYGIYQQHYNKDGTLVGSETRVNFTTASNQQNATVTGLADGGWVVTWRSFVSADASSDIFQQRYGSDGLTVGLETRVNSTVANLQSYSRTTALADGGWVVTWQSRGQDGDGQGIYQQQFAKDGTAVGAEIRVNTTTAGDQSEPSVAALSNGGWVVTWQAGVQGFSSTGIYQQRFEPNKTPSEVALVGAVIAENTANGTLVGIVSGKDANLDQGDGLTYSLLDNAGGRFALSGDKLVVANGALLDYESAASHTVVVRATDKDGLYVEKAYTIQLTDVDETPTIPVNPKPPVTPAIEPLNWRGTPGADVKAGTVLSDILRGLGGNDTLSGGDGMDRLYGGLGKDQLTGGAGADLFVFDTKLNKKTNVDQITDFTVGQDHIALQDSVFSAKALKVLGKGKSEDNPGKLSAKFFKSFDKTHPLKQDQDDYVLYNKSTGAVLYDADGSGAKAAVQIATLTKNIKLTAKDFFIV